MLSLGKHIATPALHLSCRREIVIDQLLSHPKRKQSVNLFPKRKTSNSIFDGTKWSEEKEKQQMKTMYFEYLKA